MMKWMRGSVEDELGRRAVLYRGFRRNDDESAGQFQRERYTAASRRVRVVFLFL